jgi:phage RecT family recombinase
MTDTQANHLPAINTALYGQDSKALTSRFNGGRFDKNIKWAAERQFAEQAMIKNPELQRCTPHSIQTALLDVAYSGLSLSPSLAHAYLIPYRDQCAFHPGYRGLMHMAYKAGTIKSVQVNLVRESDPEFQVWTDETGRHIKHVENQRGKQGEVTHAYCIAFLTAGGPPLIEVMGRADLNACEAAASARNRKGGMVWRSAFRDEMCKKAVIRRGSKHWPKDDGGLIERMQDIVNLHEPMDFPEDLDSDAPEQELCITLDQVTTLTDLLTDRGVQATVAPEWLKRYAQSKGYNSIEHMPARLYKECEAFLTKMADEKQ